MVSTRCPPCHTPRLGLGPTPGEPAIVTLQGIFNTTPTYSSSTPDHSHRFAASGFRYGSRPLFPGMHVEVLLLVLQSVCSYGCDVHSFGRPSRWKPVDRMFVLLIRSMCVCVCVCGGALAGACASLLLSVSLVCTHGAGLLPGSGARAPSCCGSAPRYGDCHLVIETRFGRGSRSLLFQGPLYSVCSLFPCGYAAPVARHVARRVARLGRDPDGGHRLLPLFDDQAQSRVQSGGSSRGGGAGAGGRWHGFDRGQRTIGPRHRPQQRPRQRSCGSCTARPPPPRPRGLRWRVGWWPVRGRWGSNRRQQRSCGPRPVLPLAHRLARVAAPRRGLLDGRALRPPRRRSGRDRHARRSMNLEHYVFFYFRLSGLEAKLRSWGG